MPRTEMPRPDRDHERRDDVVLRMIAEGYTNSAIAKATGLPMGTVASSSYRLYRKLGVMLGPDRSPRVLAAVQYHATNDLAAVQ